MVGLKLVRICRNESGSGGVNSIPAQQMVDVTVQKVVTEFVANADPLKSLTGDVGRIENAEGIAVTEQHAGNALSSIRLRLDCNIPTGGNRERVDWQRCH